MTINYSTGTKPLSFNPYYSSPSSGFNFGGTLDQFEGYGLNNQEARSGTGTQSATNVLDVRQPLGNTLSGFGQYANRMAGGAPQVRLGNNFADQNTFQNNLRGGIDYFGRLGMAEGLQNIGLQRGAADRQLSDMLSRGQGNSNLLAVLQNQNLMRSQLAGIPLISEAQRGTAERTGQSIELQNAVQQLRNNTQMQQAGFNQQSSLAALQPLQNLLEALSGLQGQQRGVTATETQVGAKDYK
jgi:hypothetical protein